jgi:two-component system sensor histidine kinase YesM
MSASTNRTPHTFILSLRGRLLVSILISIFFMIVIIFIYYSSFQASQKEQTRLAFEKLSNEIESMLTSNIRRINDTARQAAYSPVIQTYLLTDDPVECISSARASEEMLALYKHSNELLLDVFLYSDLNRQLFCDSNYRQIAIDFLKENNLLQNLTIDDPFFSEIRYRSYGSAKIPYVFFVFPAHSVLSNLRGTNNRIISVVPCDVDQLISFNSFQLPENSIITIESNKGEPVWCNQPLSDVHVAYLHQIPIGHSRFRLEGEPHLSYAVSIPELDCQLTCLVPEKKILDRTVYLRDISFLICLVGTLLLLFCMVLIIRSITHPVAELSHSLTLLGNDVSSRIPIPKMPELQHLARNINRMLNRIEKANQQEKIMQHQLYQAAIIQNEAELHAYRSQINPHFLFNTLECIRSIARHYRILPIEKMIRSMSRMFRYSLHARPVVTLEEELQHIQNYFTVMNERFPGRYQLRIHADEHARAHQMLSMILQPLAENCISHGFAQSKKSACILLVEGIVDAQNLLTIRITDNGTGIQPEQLHQLQKMLQAPPAPITENLTDKIGVSNIFQRLRLTFGGSFQMQIRSVSGFYTSVILQIPDGLTEESIRQFSVQKPSDDA